jgi:hypothetical protein
MASLPAITQRDHAVPACKMLAHSFAGARRKKDYVFF